METVQRSPCLLRRNARTPRKLERTQSELFGLAYSLRRDYSAPGRVSDIQLELGAVSESISVSATPNLIETRTSDVSQLVDSKTVEDMPLGDRRALNVVRISGAAVFVNYDSGLKATRWPLRSSSAKAPSFTL